MKGSYLKKSWIFLLVVQAGAVTFYFRDTTRHGIYNTDAFSYYVQFAKVPQTLNPSGEAILADPGHDLVRLPFSMPHFITGITAWFFNPLISYLIWCCLGVLTGYFSLVFFAKALGFNEHAHLVALIHYTFFHILSQLPPLSGNQLSYVLHSFLLAPESLLHFGPRQYPHDMFFYPLLYSLLALALFGIKKIKAGESISLGMSLLWGSACFLLPVNYFYHWFQYALALMVLVTAGLGFGWLKPGILWKHHPAVLITFGAVMIWWAGIVFFQNSQLADAEGYRFALMGGLTEARFVLVPAGLLVRIVLWSVVAIAVLKLKPDSVLLVGFLLGCIVLMNMQLVAGKNIQPGHWSFGVDRIFAWIALLAIAALAKGFSNRWLSRAVPVVTALTIIFYVLQTIASWSYFERMSRWNETRAEVMEFLKHQPTSVVLAPEIWLETDILIHTPHYSFLPRGAQSAVSAKEQWERLTHAAFALGYSKQGFLKWLHIRSVRFFGMLYGMEKEFSSTYFYEPGRRQGLLDFKKGDLPSWDWQWVNQYIESRLPISKKLDFVVLHAEESPPPGADEIVFKNSDYIVYRARPGIEKKWGGNLPCNEKRYPVVR